MTNGPEIGVSAIVLGRYRLDSEIGSGGMGVVWLATDTMLDQRVALKRVSFAHLSEERATLTRDRTLREARLAARLRGARHVVALYDVQVAAGEVWLVMEYHPSRSLGEVVAAGGPLPPAEVAGIGAEVAAALAHAHDLDVQHRDVTPGNVLIGEDGVAKLTDFGIAHQPGERRLTETGVVTGTVSYLAPEVARGYEAGPASDIFSLGSTLYHAVEGQPPFGFGGSQMQLLHLVSSGNIRPPERAGELAPLLLRMLELNPSTRPDATTLHAQLCRVAGRPEPRPLPAPTPAPLPGRAVQHAASTASPRATGRGTVDSRARWLLLLAGVALLAVVAVLATVSGGPIPGIAEPAAITDQKREPFDGGPARAESVWLPEDARSVDTCQLVDRTALGRFGNIRTVRGAYYEACSALISSDRDEATVEFSMDSAGTGGSDGDIVPLDGIRIVRKPPDDPKTFCANEIVLSDGSVIYVNGFPSYNADTDTPDLCTVVRTATDAATHVLADASAVPTSPSAKGNQPLAEADACEVADPAALRAVPGLQAGRVYPGFARWTCSIGSGAEGDPQVRINFLRMLADDLPGYGDRTQVGGRTAYIRDEEGLDNELECYVRVHYRDAGGSVPSDVLGVEVESDRPLRDNCAAARNIAARAQQRLGS